MVIREKLVNGIPVLSLSGRLDFFAKNAFREAIEEQKKKGTMKLFIDFRGVSLMDSVGIGALEAAVKSFREFKGNLVLVNPQNEVKSQLNGMNFSEFMPVLNTEDFSTFTKIS